jgi:hypothetical protein
MKMGREYLSRIVSIFVFSWLFTGCGSDLYLNKSYNFQSKDTVTIAISPVGSQPTYADTAFARIFEDSTRAVQLLSPTEVRQALFSSTTLVSILNTIVSNTHSDADLAGDPNVVNLIGSKNFDELQRALTSAELILIPVSFNISSALGHTFGFTKFRLYDLHSGALVYEKSMDLNVDVAGEAGARYLTAALIAFAYEDFEKNYLNKVARLRPAANSNKNVK